MSADYLKEAEEASTRPPVRAEDTPRHDTNAQRTDEPAQAADLLSDSRLRGRANEPVRIALMQDMQQTHGNRAVQRFVQRSAQAGVAAPEEDLAGRIQQKSGSGAGLDSGVQQQLERGLGSDLSGVRVHTDTESDSMARQVDAVAFTSGSDIFFRDGAYNPSSQEGMQLLAHEATHTVQQAQGPVAGTPAPGGVSISDPSDSYEQAADRAATNVVSGSRGEAQAVPGQAPGAAVQRQEEGEDEQKKKVEEEDGGLAVQALRASRAGLHLQRAIAPGATMETLGGGAAGATAEEQGLPQIPEAEQGGPGQEVAAGALEALGLTEEETTAARNENDLSRLANEQREVQAEQNQPQQPETAAEERLDQERQRALEKANNASSSSGLASAPGPNSAVQAVFDASVVSPLRQARDNLLGKTPNATTAYSQVTQTHDIAAALASTYQSEGDQMLAMRLIAVQDSAAIDMQSLMDHFQAPQSFVDIGNDLDPDAGWLGPRFSQVMSGLHTPTPSSGPLSTPPNPALQAIFQAGVIDPIRLVHDNLVGDAPSLKGAIADIKRAILVVGSFDDAYRNAGDEFMAEQMAALYNGLVSDYQALADHLQRKSLKKIGTGLNPDIDPAATRFRKIRDELH